MILHEGGHQSLFLHSAFGDLLENPRELASHPLRSDPRPVGGTMHAAHVLGRMAIGFSRWCATGTAPAAAHTRRDEIVKNLGVTFAVLNEKARWTPAGAAYYEELRVATAEVLR